MDKKKKILVDVSGANWKLMRKQKLYLIKLNTEYSVGIVNFLDSIQDQAAEQIGEKKVFGKLT